MKRVDYDSLSAIPEKLKNYSREDAGGDRIRLALATRDRLLMDMLLKLAWRPQIICGCKIGLRKVANIFKGQMPVHVPMGNRKRVKAARRVTRRLWQVHFRPEEMKSGRPVQFVVPRQLATLLEEYLEHHRPLLVRGEDPGRLFLNSAGRPLTPQSLRRLVRILTARFAGRSVSPWYFRHALAVKWLEEHPNDYLTLSKILWHTDMWTVLNTYYGRFDKPRAARRLNKWLARNRKVKRTKGR